MIYLKLHMRENIILYPIIVFLSVFFGRFALSFFNPNTIISALFFGLLFGGTALGDSYIYRCRLKTINEGKEVPWWQKDKHEISWIVRLIGSIIFILVIMVMILLMVIFFG